MTYLLQELKKQEEKLFNCVHCGFCLPACPTYTRLGDEADSPRGRLHFMRAVVEERIEPGSPALIHHLDRCLGCRACESVCPSGVEYGRLLEGAREITAAAGPRKPLSKVLARVMASPTLLAQAAIFFFNGLAAAPASWIPAWIFSQTRGTPRNSVGCTSRRFSPSFSRLSANAVHAPL